MMTMARDGEAMEVRWSRSAPPGVKAGGPGRRAEPSRGSGYARPMASHELTQEGHDRLRAELQELTTDKRVEISLWIERAREHGDIKENADYDAAKNAQGLNEARIRQLEAMLKDSVVVQATKSADAVKPGVIVELD